MRTTVRLDDDLMKQAKEYAVRHGRTLTSVIEDSLRHLLSHERQSTSSPPVEFVKFEGDGLQPGIDLNDRTTWEHIIDEDTIDRLRGSGDATT